MPDSFGARLRQRREERQIDLIAVSEQTKIKLSLLEGLERDDVSQWPSGIFRRAYIRAYAQMIGLDPDTIVREFLEVHRDAGDACVPTAATAAAEEEEYARNAPSLRLRTVVGSAIESLTRLRRSAGEQPVPTALPPLPEEAVVVVDMPETENVPIERVTEQPPADPLAAEDRAVYDSTLETIARVCTDLGRAADREDVRQLLEDSAAALSATGLIVWVWDTAAEALRPALVHGYSEKVLAHVPAVARDADNATAAAFRTRTTCEVGPSAGGSGALVVPMLIPDGCAGVLALELQPGIQPTRSLRAMAMVLAAAITQLLRRVRTVAHQPDHDAPDPVLVPRRPPARPTKVRR